MRRLLCVVLLLVAGVARAEDPVGIIQSIDRRPDGRGGAVSLAYPDGSAATYLVSPRTVVYFFDHRCTFADLQPWWPAYVHAPSGAVALRIVAFPYIP